VSADVVVAVLGAGGLSAILGAGITAMSSKRKLGAEATKIITDAAAGVVTSMEHQLERAQQALESAEQRHEAYMNRMASAHVRERDEWKRVLQLHVAWDALAISKLAELRR
jgi:3-hydroxyacyl-CoA dehydrogenase